VPETLRTYARLMEAWRRDPVSRDLRPPGDVCQAAAKALRFMADAIERNEN
jgi:hypothetical protein